MGPIADASPERNEDTSDANNAKREATRFDSYSPQGRNERMYCKKLRKCATTHSNSRRSWQWGKEAHKSDESRTNFAYLLDDTLGRAIGPRCNLPVSGPSDIENTTHSLDDIKRKKRELSHDKHH
jgi:hypothetical protein